MYCMNCGTKLSDDSKFCTSCGVPQLVEEEILIAHEPKETSHKVVKREIKANNITQQQKKVYQIVFIAIAIIVIAFLSAKRILTDIHSPEKLVTEYINGIKAQDKNVFKELTHISAGGYDESGVWVDNIQDATMTEEEVQVFLTTYSSNQDMLLQVYNELMASIVYAANSDLNAERGMLYIEEESSNILYTKYKVVFNKPIVNISSNMEGAVLYVAGQEITLHIAGTKVSLLPGDYEYNALYKAENIGTELKIEPNKISVVYGENLLDIPFQYSAVHIYREDELFTLKDIYINDVRYSGDLTNVSLLNGLDISPIPINSTIRVVVSAYDKELQQLFNVADYSDGMVLLQPDLWQEIKDEAITTAMDATGLYLRIGESLEQEACDEFESKYKATSKKLVKQIKKELKEQLKVDNGYYTIDNLSIINTQLDNIKYYADKVQFTTHIYYDGEWVYHPKIGKKKTSGDPQPIEPYLRVYVVFEYANGVLSMKELREGHN